MVWTPQPPAGQYAYLAQKGSDGSWHDYPVSRAEALHLPDDTANLYFAPSLFTDQRRLRKFAAPGRWLYADLDEVPPSRLEELDVPATIAWETSPGRYQCLWHLKRALSPKALARLNQKMTYYVGADHNGWSLTKVLRVPGTVSTKHSAPFTVRVVSRAPGASYEPRKLAQLLRDVQTPADLQNARTLKLPSASRRALLRKHTLSARTKKLLNTKTPTAADDRSARLWELCRLLIEHGYSPEETFVLVRPTVWNKWEDDDRLWLDVQKAAAQPPRDYPKRDNAKKRKRPQVGPTIELSEVAADEIADEPPTFTPIRLARYLAKRHPDPTWLVDKIWGLGASGMWQGDIKTYKSTILSDLAISVASGLPFLNTFEVLNPGPVLMIQEENGAAFMTDRLHRIMASKGLGPHYHGRNGNGQVRLHLGTDVDVELLNMKRFNLSDDSHMRWLDAYIAERRFRLVILDPLYRLAPGKNEKEAIDMDPITDHIQTIAYERQVAIPLIHHYKKPTEHTSNLRAAHRTSGTLSLGRWWESAAFTERVGEETDYTVKFHAEHRELPPSPAYHVKFTMPAEDPNAYSVEVEEVKKEERVQADMSKAGVKRIWIEDVVKRTGKSTNTVRRQFERLGYTITTAERKGRRRLLATKGE